METTAVSEGKGNEQLREQRTDRRDESTERGREEEERENQSSL